MIFTDKKITSESILVRFYEWMDKEKGYGDAGTVLYKRIPLSWFTLKTKGRVDGSIYYTYSIDSDKAKSLLGNYWWTNYGYGIGKKSDLDNQISALEKQLKLLKSFKV